MDEKPEQIKDCRTCKWRMLSMQALPCSECLYAEDELTYWEAPNE